MLTVFISDIHLNPARPDSFARFESFMTQAAKRVRRLYVLGDMVDYWVGDDGVDAIGQGRAEAALRAAVDAGVEVFFMRGNRDFLIGDAFARRTGCKLLADPTVVMLPGGNIHSRHPRSPLSGGGVDDVDGDVDGDIHPRHPRVPLSGGGDGDSNGDGNRRVLLTHGDALCTDDVEHQAARKEVLSAKWQFAFMQKPLDARIDAAAAMRARSESRKQRTSAAMMDVNQTAVENLMREHRVDTLIHGHTHRPGVHQFTVDGRPAWRYVLGDWHAKPSALYYEHGALALKR